MKRFALTAFTIVAVWNLAPNFVKATDVTRNCIVEKAVLGHPRIHQMGTSHITFNCAGKKIPEYTIPYQERDRAEILGEGGEYRVTTNEGSWIHPRSIVRVTEIKPSNRRTQQRARLAHLDPREKVMSETKRVTIPEFTVTYPCAAFERAGLQFPFGTEARYPEGCNVFAELDADKREERRIAMAETTQAKWSEVAVVPAVHAPKPKTEKPIKTARIHKPKPQKQEVLPWQVAVSTPAYESTVRVHKPKTIFDYLFNLN